MTPKETFNFLESASDKYVLIHLSVFLSNEPNGISIKFDDNEHYNCSLEEHLKSLEDFKTLVGEDFSF